MDHRCVFFAPLTEEPAVTVTAATFPSDQHQHQIVFGKNYSSRWKLIFEFKSSCLFPKAQLHQFIDYFSQKFRLLPLNTFKNYTFTIHS